MTLANKVDSVLILEPLCCQWRTQKKISVGAKYMSGGFSLANSNNFGIFHTNIQRFYNNSKI
jgi:hypothetical protein